jgi:hypothetical protein
VHGSITENGEIPSCAMVQSAASAETGIAAINENSPAKRSMHGPHQ